VSAEAIIVIRNARDDRMKAHLPAITDESPFRSLAGAACGRVVWHPERVPLAQTDPSDRCRFCFREAGVR